ncbi:MAG: ATP-grasp domain-containing protein [Chitinophagaceae bacterium]|nr:ATP-grasp domain-containing protein [Chitinophagaceae bacterium]
MPEQTINILMTGGGAPGAAGIIKCLREEKSFKIFVADANADAIGKHLGDHFEKIPLADSPEFVDKLLSICKQHNIQIILPLVTKELIPLSSRINEFAAIRTKVLISPQSSLEIANNKSRLYEFLQWRGIKVPSFSIVETVEQFKEAVTALGYPEKQVCFKPSVSNGSRGFRIISERINELDLLFNYKPAATFITLNNAINILASGTFPELLVSEYLSGEEYSVDCLANHGETVLIVPRLRKKMINGISVEGEFVEEESIINYCQQIIKELQLHGNIGIQVKKAVSGEFLILEINPRVQGTIAATLGTGTNLPVLAVKQELGLPIAADDLKVKWGTKFSRHWSEVFY